MPDTKTLEAPAATVVQAARLFIVDDDPLICSGFSDMLEGTAGTIETFESAEAFLEAYRPGECDCMLLDHRLPGMSGVDLLQHIRSAGYRLRVVMVTGNGDVQTAVAAMKAGAFDFIEKPVNATELQASVARAVAQPEGEPARQVGEGIAGLTRRQHDILQRVLEGHPSKIIAQDLGISQRTVENHRAAIMKKAGVRSVPALVRIALLSDDRQLPVAAASRPAAQMPAPGQLNPMFAITDFADVLDYDQFKRFFDQIPVAIVVGLMKQPESIAYANPEFERLSGHASAEVEGRPWSILPGLSDSGVPLGSAIAGATEFVGSFTLPRDSGEPAIIDAYSNVIEDEDGKPAFRLAALVDVGMHDAVQRQAFEQRIEEKDMLLREVQHRVKNNLQMITALIRAEARRVRGTAETAPFDRLAGRIKAIQMAYELLADPGATNEIDLGIYLSDIVSSVMRAHAQEGIRLDLKVDTYPVSVNVAMPAGLVVNELLTNALKYAFAGRDGGTITVQSLSEAEGCRVVIADDGVGLPDGVEWPKHGKLSELIVRSLRQNAKAELLVESSPAKGMRVTIIFPRSRAAAQ
jgi:FixJ family two-component response regulator/two-component sensor histidine kinase